MDYYINGLQQCRQIFKMIEVKIVIPYLLQLFGRSFFSSLRYYCNNLTGFLHYLSRFYSHHHFPCCSIIQLMKHKAIQTDLPPTSRFSIRLFNLNVLKSFSSSKSMNSLYTTPQHSSIQYCCSGYYTCLTNPHECCNPLCFRFYKQMSLWPSSINLTCKQAFLN